MDVGVIPKPPQAEPLTPLAEAICRFNELDEASDKIAEAATNPGEEEAAYTPTHSIRIEKARLLERICEGEAATTDDLRALASIARRWLTPNLRNHDDPTAYLDERLISAVVRIAARGFTEAPPPGCR